MLIGSVCRIAVMSQAHKIILVGFSAFEKVTFESFFRLAARRPPGYLLVTDASQADLAVVNADDPAVLRQCMATKPAPRVLLIGSQDGGTGWTIQRRPLNLMKVLATVEGLLTPPTATVPADLMGMMPTAPARVSPLASKAAALSPMASVPSPAASSTPSSAQFQREVSAFSAPNAASPAPLQSTQAFRSTPTTAPIFAAPTPSVSNRSSLDEETRRSVRSGMGRSYQEAPRNPEMISAFTPPVSDSAMQQDHILVVDDSDIALKFMRNRLSRFGFHADLASSGEEALGKLSTKPFKFVFLDVMMEGLDGYQTCRAIKQRKYPDGKPPVVVMLTSRGGTIDKIRGTLAGCDAYLTKPLNERDLIAVLAKHDRSVARGFQHTNHNSSSNINGKNSSGFATQRR
jgi:two-component system, cell cycle response regulator